MISHVSEDGDRRNGNSYLLPPPHPCPQQVEASAQRSGCRTSSPTMGFTLELRLVHLAENLWGQESSEVTGTEVPDEL